MKRAAWLLPVRMLLLAIPVTAFAAQPLVPIPEDTSPIDELMSGLEKKHAELYASGYYGDDNQYHVMATDIAATKSAISSDGELKKAYDAIKETVVFEQAEFTFAELEAAQSKILEVFSRNKIAATAALDARANTVEILGPEATIKPAKSQIQNAVGERLSRKLVFIDMDAPPLETAQEPPSGIAELYILDAKNQAYIKANIKATDMISSVMGKAVLLKKTLPTREGAALVFLKDGTRLSYFFEANGDLNVNGACYRVRPAAREAFEKRLAELKADASLTKRPKWLAWMQLENVAAVSSGKAQDCRDILIESGKRLALAELKPPENAREVEIAFISGVKYTLTFAGASLYIESSDMGYACAYTLSPSART